MFTLANKKKLEVKYLSLLFRLFISTPLSVCAANN